MKVIFFPHYVLMHTCLYLALLPAYQGGEELGSPLSIFESQTQGNSDSSRYVTSKEK